MREAKYNKMYMYCKQVKSIKLSQNRIKTLSSSIQNLDQSERDKVLNNWQSHSIEDEYDFPEISSVSSLEEERNNNSGHCTKHQQKQHVPFIELSDNDDESESGLKLNAEGQNDSWNLSEKDDNVDDITEGDKDFNGDYGAVGAACFKTDKEEQSKEELESCSSISSSSNSVVVSII